MKTAFVIVLVPFVSGCTDTPFLWMDKDGDNCQKYSDNGWCGADWQEEYAVNGVTADMACCLCDGCPTKETRRECRGSCEWDTKIKNCRAPGTEFCVDGPDGWEDQDGDNCVDYANNGWCGASWQDSYKDAVLGLTAVEACCLCQNDECINGHAFHSGHMVDDDAEAWDAQSCLAACNALSTCNFWDYDTHFCRLRSETGPHGPMRDGNATGGSKNCILNGARRREEAAGGKPSKRRLGGKPQTRRLGGKPLLRRLNATQSGN